MKEWNGMEWLRLLKKGPVVDSCEHVNALSVSVNYLEFLDYMKHYLLLKKDSGTCNCLVMANWAPAVLLQVPSLLTQLVDLL
jgi:hypothetical protein